MGFAADVRTALVTFLTEAASDASLSMQVYGARPKSIMPPTGFVDEIPETITNETNLPRREASPAVIVVFGTYDYLDTANRRDAFVDAFVAYVQGHYHQIEPNSMVAVEDITDLPEFIPTWLAPDLQRTYYATRIALGGFRRGT